MDTLRSIGLFVLAALAVDGFRPDRWDVAGALVCLVGVALIMYAPRTAPRRPVHRTGRQTGRQVTGRGARAARKSSYHSARVSARSEP